MSTSFKQDVEHNDVFDDKDDVSETTQLLAGNGYQGNRKCYGCEEQLKDIRTFSRRWYILFIFSIMSFTQNTLWNTWAPLAISVQRAYGWGSTVVAILTGCGATAFLLSAPFASWLMDTKGLRVACIYGSGMLLLGTGVRCIPASGSLLTGLTITGQLIMGLCGTVAMGAPPLLSAVWFPPEQRNTATAMSTGVGGLGMSMSFVIGLIYSPGEPNGTVNFSETSSTGQEDVEIQRQISTLMYIESGITAVIFVVILVYFPDKPPKPPSASSAAARLDYLQGFRELVRKTSFWTLALVYGASSGVYYGWSSVLAVNLQPLGITQETTGWLGFLGTSLGNVAGLFVAIFADVFRRRAKLLLVILFTISSIAFLVFSLVSAGIVPFHVGSLYACSILGGITVFAAIPLFYELVCEAVYPVAEGIANISLTSFNNIATLSFFLAMLGGSEQQWMNWCMFGAVVVCVPILLLHKEHYRRLDIDTQTTTRSSSLVTADKP